MSHSIYNSHILMNMAGIRQASSNRPPGGTTGKVKRDVIEISDDEVRALRLELLLMGPTL
jgi:hypothetical protein